MTHSLHREGSLESLEKDYVLFIYPARGFNYKGSAPKVRHMVELLYQAGPVNMIPTSLRRNMYSGVTNEEILDSITVDGTRVYSVFNDREKLKKALILIKEADEGISIMVSGLTDRVREIAAELGINPHMINLSLGIHGTDGPPAAGRHPGVHDDVRPRRRLAPPGQGHDPPGQDGKGQRMGRKRAPRGALHLRDLQPLPLRGTAPGKGAALHGGPLVARTVANRRSTENQVICSNLIRMSLKKGYDGDR